MTKRKPHLFIATPMFGGMCSSLYTARIINLAEEMMKRGIPYNFCFRHNESLITRGRNALVSAFMDTDATHLLFIDADIGFKADQVLHMVDANKDIICGIYPKKSINWNGVVNAAKSGVPVEEISKYSGEWVVNFKDYIEGATIPIDQPFEIWNGGTGMMLIKREVFEKLKDNVPYYVVNETDPLMIKKAGTKIPEYFATSIDDVNGVLLSEDYHFCKIWRNIGGSVWAAPWVELDHVGSYTFGGRPERTEQ